MKKYKQILAGLLAMSLAVYEIPASVVKISASEESYNEDIAEDEQKEVELSAAMATDIGNAEETGYVDKDQDDETEESDLDVPDEDNSEDNTADSDEITNDVIYEESESEEEQIINETQEETEQENETSEQENEPAVQSVSGSTIDLEQLLHYENNTMTITSAEELILLSNCDQSKVKGITITFSGTGNEMDLTKGISAGTDISQYFKDTSSAAVENQQVMVSDNRDISDETEEQTDTAQGRVELEQETVEAELADEETTQDTDQNIAMQSITAGQDYVFKGIGTADALFEGSIANATSSITVAYTFFGGLSSKAKIKTPLSVIWAGKDSSMPMAVSVYQFDSSPSEGSSHTLPIKITGTTTMGSLIGTVQATANFENQILNIEKDTVTYGSNEVSIDSDTNAGLICNSLKGGSICLNGYSLPTQTITVNSSGTYNENDKPAAGNAGGLVGVMGANTELQINSVLNNTSGSDTNATTTSITVTGAGNAGGLVGLMENGSKITTADKKTVTLKDMKITGSSSAGGVVGEATNVIWNDNNLKADVTVNSSTLKGNKSGANVGGFIGKYILSSSENEEYILSGKIKINNPKLIINGDQRKGGGSAGGYFGLLELNGTINYTVGQSDIIAFNASYDEASTGGNAWSYGTLVGQVTTTNSASGLKIQNMTVTSKFPTYKTTPKRPQYYGGLIGYIGDDQTRAYVEIQNAVVTAENPHAFFGGAVGCLGQNSILKIKDIKVTTKDGGQDAKIWSGGGVLGQASAGSVLELSGKTDLSEVNYERDDRSTGQLVGDNTNALIYARGDGNGDGWKYIRSNFANSKGNTYNDLLCYGQVLRLKSGEASTGTGLSADLITIGDSHTVTLKKISALDLGTKTITLRSTDDFALLSIAWNSRGWFGSESGITTDNWDSIKNSTITIADDIDLTGTGVLGLSRDTDTADDTFNGTLNGGTEPHKITLAIGETYGFQGKSAATLNTSGCGIIYATTGKNYHALEGLFAKTDDATIRNITLGGNISVSNAFGSITAGGIASQMKNITTVDNVTVQESIYADGVAEYTMSVGGLYGTENGGTLNLTNQTVIAPKIDLKKISDRGSWICAGGVLGKAVNANFNLKVNNAVIGNSEESEQNYAYINTDTNNYAYVGGMIGLVGGLNANKEHPANLNQIIIEKLLINGFKIDADSATEVSGGLLGSIWENVEVQFNRGNENNDQSALIVKNCTVSAKVANGVGGLAYRSSGHWQIDDNGIDMQSLNIVSGGDVGLLVCRGEKGQTKYENKDVYTDIEALYLNTTAYWDTAYKLADITIKQSNDGVFDEFMAHTSDTAEEITENGKNGMVSIATATAKRVGVAENGTNCTTYQNRTAYGKNKTNSCSRYYYDLDECLNEVNTSDTKNDQKINTAAELMLWSAYWYASEDIRKYLADKNSAPDILVDYNDYIPTITGSLDMQKYSYYPVDLVKGLKIQEADITFYNEEIESTETAVSNKTTQGTNAKHSQHYTMHCGLFLNQSGDTTVSLSNVKFAGSIGKVNQDGSGVLFSGTVQGSFDTSMHTAKINLENVSFAGLKVYGCSDASDYAPLLINKVESYSTLDVNGIKIAENANYTPGRAAATSLIGRVGTETSKQMNLSFLDIILPDKWTAGSEGIFTNATLLEWFKHDGTSSVGTYNFNKSREWTDTTYAHGVTYGYEITGTEEYKNLQLWYYDASGYGTSANRVHTNETDQESFSSIGYLRYVHKEYNTVKHSHEIKVNQRMENIVDGCGTYGHPYRIKTAREMQILSQYMSNGTAPEGWCVTITSNQAVNHIADSTTDNSYSGDVTYKYKGNHQWVKVKKVTGVSSEKWAEDESADTKNVDSMMQDYLLSAYYDLQGTENTLELTDFGGFGNEANPFRGVLTSTDTTTATEIVLKGNAPANGLIGYGYGCVVKNLKISYKNCNSKTLINNVTSTGTDTGTSGSTTAIYYYSKVVFGGVIGCILGGDNIIDSVSVEYENNWLTIDGTKKHLIPVGGYVGEVSGGGVIFRNLKDTDTGLANIIVNNAKSIGTAVSMANMYVNPYVGRVLDGFAFYEVTKTGTDASGPRTRLDNTEKNYQINTLSDTDKDCVTMETSDTEQVVKATNAKGLLILSAVVNSGAASNGVSNAYNSDQGDRQVKIDAVKYSFGGKYGKVRNADYSGIGTETNTTDFALSKNDDCTKPGKESLPYLIKKYCGGNSSIFSLADSAKIILSDDAPYDMTTFGTGYQGIGARYVSSAILNGDTVTPTSIVPNLVKFNGNNSTITLNMPVKEYIDDDFRTAAIGGVFNMFSVDSGSEISNLTIQGIANGTSEVSLKYYASDGNVSTRDTSVTDVGGFAGTVSRIKNADKSVCFNAIHGKDLKITAPRNAGGFLGSSITKSGTDLYDLQVEELLVYTQEYGSKNIGIALINSYYDNLTVTADIGAGGCVGYIDSDSSSFAVTGSKLTVGEDSTITSTHIYATTDNKDTKSGAGGVFGYVKATVNINTGIDDTEAYKEAAMQDVTVAANMYAGGFVGKIDGKVYKINLASCVAKNKKGTVLISTKVEAENQTGTSNSRREGAGGIIGYAKGISNSDGAIENCSLEDVQINNSNTATSIINQNHEGAGGIIGLITDSKSVNIEDCTVTNSNIYGAVAGGIAGITKSSTTFKNCSVTGTAEIKSNVKGRDTASGILGYWFYNGEGILENCHVRYVDIAAYDWGIGALIGDGDSTGGNLYVYDTSVRDSNVTAVGGNRWYQPGGIIGDLRSDLTASNLLFSDVSITMPSNANPTHFAGLLVANYTTGKKIQIAGVSIQNIPEDSKTLELVGNSTSYTGYIAFADYEGTALEEAKQENATDLLGATAASPYVVTSPKSALSVYESADSDTAKFLYGDGVYWNSSNIKAVEAQTIWNNRKLENGEHYAYTNTGITGEFDFSVISTYNTNNANVQDKPDDFPVIELSGGDADTVKDYLDILTNGGFSIANVANGSYVTAKTEVYEYKDGRFIKSDVKPAFQVTKDKNNQISFLSTTDYDNDKNRFTLLTVTFTAGNNHTYNVMVPVIVRRMLEINFSATLSYGTNFLSTDYMNLYSHVLESFGSSITGFLRYTYNSDAKKEFSDYGWQSYIDAGGNVAESLHKEIWFKQTKDNSYIPLPTGTQLSLVDHLTGKVYYYTATGKETENANKIPLENFKDSDGNTYQEPSIAELMKVEVKEDTTGSFIKVESDGRPEGTGASDAKYDLPTVRIKNTEGKYEYYRLAGNDETGTKYSVTVDESKLQSNNKSQITEEYYLVITVPSNSESNDMLNGTLSTDISTEIPHDIHFLTIQGENDPQYNTASTYRISKGYKQKLNEQNITALSKKMSTTVSTMTVDVVDTITFPKAQAYQDDNTSAGGKDELYQRFVGGWQKTENEASTAVGIPNDTEGYAHFYIYRKNGDQNIYYKYENGVWSESGNTPISTIGYKWSGSGSMELPLSTDGSNANAVSLQGVRKLVKDKTATDDCTFYVELKMDLELSTSGLGEIPESTLSGDTPNDFIKLLYSSQLSTEKKSLAYSTNRASEQNTKTAYYRDAPVGTKLTYDLEDPDAISQLGINLLDMQDSSDEFALIDTKAEYNLEAMKNLDEILKDSGGIKFTLSLMPKNTEGNLEDYQEAQDIAEYLNVTIRSQDSGIVEHEGKNWSWIVPKSSYWDGKNAKTDSVFTGTTLLQFIRLKINIKNVSEKEHYYSNYKVVLKAEILSSDGKSSVDGTEQTDNIIYTLAKIDPTFVD